MKAEFFAKTAIYINFKSPFNRDKCRSSQTVVRHM